ncbi:hypothetical protein HY992_05180 [Candidatus Micrarchaeota archaeon]|nr:hypothetical protein [Candidatus Micrarchaeota archaeon]
MSAEEKQLIIEAWDRHVEKNVVSKKHGSFSSTAEEAFRETFKNGIMALEKLTQKEKVKLLKYAGL